MRLVVLINSMLFRSLLINGIALCLLARVLKQGIVIGTWNRRSNRVWNRIKAIGYHDMLSVLLLEKCFTVRLVQVVFKLDRASIEMHVDRSGHCNQVVRSKIVPGRDCIRLMSEQQRGNLLKRRNGVTRRNHTEFKFAVIEIDIRSEFNGVCI